MIRAIPTRYIALALMVLGNHLAAAQDAPATQPAIPIPSQFSDEHLCVDLVPGASGTKECAGTISVGGWKSDRKFPLRGRIDEAGVITGQFTDDSGSSFSFTARQEDTTLVLQTGRTTYTLERAMGNPGIVRMMLEPASDGFKVNGLIKDGPAERAGIRTGDVITAIDDREIAGRDVTMLGLRGYVGTQVTVKVRHPNGEVESYQLTRAPFDRGLLGFPQGDNSAGRRDR
jgi:membrane-associated protease RseP (regulator of RpoE activity)